MILQIASQLPAASYRLADPPGAVPHRRQAAEDHLRSWRIESDARSSFAP
jgi:hypothetical protein